MTVILNADSPDFFFRSTAMDEDRVQTLVEDAIGAMDDGELYLEFSQSESLAFDDGRLKNASFNTEQGFGLRGVINEATGYAHSSDLSEDAIRRAGETVQAVRAGRTGTVAENPRGTNRALYAADNPLTDIPFEQKVRLLEEIDTYARNQDSRVRQVSASLFGEWQVVEIIRAGGQRVRDIRPLVRLNVSVILGEGERQESGFHGSGGRFGYHEFFAPDNWRNHVAEAIRQAEVNLQSIPAPAGEMEVALGPGWPGVLLHEAVGHGLEGDFNRKQTSAFSGLIGERVAAKGVTVIDDGTMEQRRGSLTVDDEGTPTSRNILIEDGILKGYMQDRLNARLMGVAPTGNGRRQNYAHAPMPRMTNTFMLAGDRQPEEIIAAMKDGVYAVNFGGGQVDITSGKFVFSCTEAYRVQNGKIGAPVKGATLIGNGPEAMKKVRMIGNDLKLDTGVGTCGKAGQSIPAGVGQPTLLMDGLTVGGTG